MKLPERAASVWREIEPLIGRARAELPSGQQRLSLGGGTVLAARWGHRRSHDIDLFVGWGTEANALVAPWSDWAGVEIERIGGRLEARGPNPDRHIRMSFPNHPTLQECGGRHHPARGGASRPGEGRHDRNDRCPGPRHCADSAGQAGAGRGRTWYGMCSTSRQPRGSIRAPLAIATNCCTHQYVEVIAGNWHLARHTLARKARTGLEGVVPRYAVVPEELADAGAGALRDALYERVEAHRVQDGVEIVATTRGGWRNEFVLHHERLGGGNPGNGHRQVPAGGPGGAGGAPEADP